MSKDKPKINRIPTKGVPLKMTRILAEKMNEVVDTVNEISGKFGSLPGKVNNLVKKFKVLEKSESSKKKGTNMKKLGMLILVVLLTCQAAFGQASTSNLDRVSDVDMKSAILRAGLTVADFQGGGLVSSGNPYYVDTVNGGSDRSGRSWILAMDTLDGAINKVAFAINAGTEKGDSIIYIREGSSETISGIDADVTGLTIRGLGRGDQAPLFTYNYDETSSGFMVGAPGVRLENLRFQSSLTSVSAAIYIESAGDYAEIVGCVFLTGVDRNIDEFDNAIYLDQGANGVRIHNNEFDSGSAGAVSAIYFGSVSDCIITDNTILGDYSTACINNATYVAGGIRIENNLLFNGTLDGDNKINDVRSIAMFNGSGGLIRHNDIVNAELDGTGNNTGVTMRVADDMVFINNMMTATDGDEFSGGIESGTASITLSEASD